MKYSKIMNFLAYFVIATGFGFTLDNIIYDTGNPMYLNIILIVLGIWYLGLNKSKPSNT